MHSIRTKITLLTVCVIVIAVTTVSLLSVVFITKSEHQESDQMLLLLCETGERNLDLYFNSVQKSVGNVASYIEKDINGLDDEKLQKHIDRVDEYFDMMASKTNGVLTYYYRIDPGVSDKVKGFWYTDLDGEGFVAHEVTDITKYDLEDTSKLVWFTKPRSTGEPVWLPPYITDNLDVRVISYNVPIYYKDTFVGVAGIEIDYSTMAEQVESIRLFDNGYAFLTDPKGGIIFHPRIDVASLTEEELPETPEGLITEDTFVRYSYDGVAKRAAWLPLSNGMRLTVSVPVAETDGDWKKLIRQVALVSVLVLLAVGTFAMIFAGRITRPLEQLIKAAEHVDNGRYDFELEYDEDDEVGRLTQTFKLLSSHMKDHINDLNKRVFVDALTSVKNKGAFTAAIDDLQAQIEEGEGDVEFAIGVFDCNNLKKINDEFGHDRGDTYLKTASRLICRIFQHSPVFRIGGDEFSVILKNDDFNNREELIKKFEEDSRKICEATDNPWERVDVAMGIAVYDPENDRYVTDTERRADKMMYMNKQQAREARREIKE